MFRSLRSHPLRSLLATASLLVPVLVWASPAAGAPPPQVFASPATGLTDFQPVHLTGSGFEPYALLEWFECRGGAVSEADCDGYNADFIDVDGAGNVSETVYVDARIYLPDGTAVDCRTDAAGCELGVGFMVDADEWPEVAIEFDPAAPLRPVVTGTVAPATDLVDGQEVAFTVQHSSFREETFAYLCATGTGLLGERCDLDHLTRIVVDPTGEGSGTLVVHAPFRPPLGQPVDCRAPGTECVVKISWGFAPPPDRTAEVPVAFVPAEVPTSSTTSTTSTTAAPTTVPPSAPPAAEPVAATASYTG